MAECSGIPVMEFRVQRWKMYPGMGGLVPREVGLWEELFRENSLYRQFSAIAWESEGDPIGNMRLVLGKAHYSLKVATHL